MKTLIAILGGALTALLGTSTTSHAGLAVSVGSASVPVGSPVSISVTASDLDNVIGFQGTLAWDTTLLQYNSVGNFGLPGLTAGLFTFFNDKLRVAWIDETTLGVSPTQPEIFRIYFTAGPNSGYTTVSFTDEPLECLVTYSDLTQATFAASAGVGSVTLTAVPEPITLALGLFGSFFLAVGTGRWLRARRLALGYAAIAWHRASPPRSLPRARTTSPRSPVVP